MSLVDKGGYRCWWKFYFSVESVVDNKRTFSISINVCYEIADYKNEYLLVILHSIIS